MESCHYKAGQNAVGKDLVDAGLLLLRSELSAPHGASPGS